MVCSAWNKVADISTVHVFLYISSCSKILFFLHIWCFLGLLLLRHTIYCMNADMWICQNTLMLFQRCCIHYNNNVHKHCSYKRDYFSRIERAKNMWCFTCQNVKSPLFIFEKQHDNSFFSLDLELISMKSIRFFKCYKNCPLWRHWHLIMTKKLKTWSLTQAFSTVTCSLFEFNPQPSSFPDPYHVTGVPRSLQGLCLDKKAL